jgi:hypothetical protein
VIQQDVEKRRAWVVRFERFRASGLSVTRFCEQEPYLVKWALFSGSQRRTS